MNSLRKLLWVIVSMVLLGSAFAVERTRNPDAPAAARTDASHGVSSAPKLIAPVVEPGLPGEANFRLASAAAVQSMPGDAGQGRVRAVSGPAGVAAPETARAAPGSSRMPLAAVQEPAEWMQLLCGLVVAGFIARRRANLVAD